MHFFALSFLKDLISRSLPPPFLPPPFFLFIFFFWIFLVLYSEESLQQTDQSVWLLREFGAHLISSSLAPFASLTCSCCWRARSICCRCFSICEAASFFCSSCAARSCSRKLISWVIMVESWRSFSARLSGVPKWKREEISQAWVMAEGIRERRGEFRRRTP